MTTRPTAPTDWADAVGANRATVPTAIRDLGVPPGDVFRSAYYNEALHDVGLWLTYLKDYAPSEGTLSAGRILGTGDPEDAARSLTITSEMDSKAIFVVATTTASSLWLGVQGGADDALFIFDRDTGIVTATGVELRCWTLPMNGVTAIESTDGGLRYRFADQETLYINIAPQSGGWTFQRATTGSATGRIVGASAANPPLVGSPTVQLTGTANTGDCWRRPFHEIESSAGRIATSPCWQIAGLFLKVDVAASGTVRIRICKRNRLTGSETAFGSWVVESNTTPTGPHVFSYVPGSAQDFDLSNYTYFFEMDVSDSSASSQEIMIAHVVLLKGAAD